MDKTEPAFPQGMPEHGSKPGLTKREYFSALALQGILANPDIKTKYKSEEITEERLEVVNSHYTKIAICLADHLILELAK